MSGIDPAIINKIEFNKSINRIFFRYKTEKPIVGS